MDDILDKDLRFFHHLLDLLEKSTTGIVSMGFNTPKEARAGRGRLYRTAKHLSGEYLRKYTQSVLEIHGRVLMLKAVKPVASKVTILHKEHPFNADTNRSSDKG